MLILVYYSYLPMREVRLYETNFLLSRLSGVFACVLEVGIAVTFTSFALKCTHNVAACNWDNHGYRLN